MLIVLVYSVVRLTAQRTALLISLFFVLIGLAYIAVTPIFEAPDESSHFFYIHNLLNTRQLPVILSRAAMRDAATPIELRLSVQVHHPPLYYLLGAALVSWTQRADALDHARLNPLNTVGTVAVNNRNANLHPPGAPRGDTTLAVYVLRLYSLALGLGTLWCVYRAGDLAFLNPAVGLTAMLVVACIPQFAYISSSISNDNAVTFFYSLGVYTCLRLWRRGQITRWDGAMVGVILAGAALSKTTGLGLAALVMLTLTGGLLLRRFRWRAAVMAALIASLGFALLAGWWYLRNQTLYGDPLGLNATLPLWSRGEPLSALNAYLIEGKGAWESFWMVLGHFNVRGPDWLFTYVPAITLVGLTGCLWLVGRRPERRTALVFLVAVCILVIATMVIATRQINVSQGRILFPALAAFAPLLAAGWQQIMRRYSPLLVMPLAVLALLAPGVYIPDAFPGLTAVASPSPDARGLGARAESLEVVAYQVRDAVVLPGGVVRLWVYIRGQHPEEPILFVKALDPATQTPLGGIDVFPGMASTALTDPDTIYRLPLAFTLDKKLTEGLGPYRLDLSFGWRVLTTDRYLWFVDANGTRLKGLVMPGPTLIDPTRPAPTPPIPAEVTFGDAIRLSGYGFSAPRLKPGEALTVSLHWRYLNPLAGEWVAGVGLLDAANQVVAQADGSPAGYPVSAWQPGPDFVDQRTLTIPANTPPGTLRLYLAWYRLGDLTRLPARGAGVNHDNLFIAPESITVVSG